MILPPAFLLALTAGQMDLSPRFRAVAPLAGAPPVTIDTQLQPNYLKAWLPMAHRMQGRVLWIDATANVDRYDTDAKLADLVEKIASAGFNTVVLDIKPISGQVNFTTAMAPRLKEWKGKRLNPEIDVLRSVLRHAKPRGLDVFISLNALSEGHRLFRVGPGYGQKDRQTVIYDTRPIVRMAAGQTFPLSLTKDVGARDAIAEFTSADRLPAARSDAFAVTLRANGQIVDGFMSGGLPPAAPAVPKGGVILYATGALAERLKAAVRPGERVQFDAEPEFVPMGDWTGSQIPLMMNPNHPEVRKYELAFLADVVRRYPVDGVFYDDRLRYAGMYADFSEITHRAFERAVGAPVQWPDDVFRFTLTQDLRKGIRPGRYYDQWMAWRGQVLKQFVADARATVKRARPNAVFGAYVGSWYGEYPALGHNYSSEGLNSPFWFNSPNYQAAGTGALFDVVIPGCYYTTATVAEAMERGVEVGPTVEAAGALVNQLVRGRAWTYAGLSLIDFKDNPDGLTRALQAALSSTQGVMVFDLSHDIDPMWPVFRKAFGKPLPPPHRMGRPSFPRDPFRMTTGAAGTGQ